MDACYIEGMSSPPPPPRPPPPPLPPPPPPQLPPPLPPLPPQSPPPLPPMPPRPDHFLPCEDSTNVTFFNCSIEATCFVPLIGTRGLVPILHREIIFESEIRFNAKCSVKQFMQGILCEDTGETIRSLWMHDNRVASHSTLDEYMFTKCPYDDASDSGFARLIPPTTELKAQIYVIGASVISSIGFTAWCTLSSARRRRRRHGHPIAPPASVAP